MRLSKSRIIPILIVFVISAVIAGCKLTAEEQETANNFAALLEHRVLKVVSIGDSYASGEGSPGPNRSRRWTQGNSDAELCHRSVFNAHTGAIGNIESDWIGEILYQSFACSGASITRGLLGPQFSEVEPCISEPTAFINCTKTQIDQAEEWLASLPEGSGGLDILIISIGGNDAGFGEVLAECLTPSIATYIGLQIPSCAKNVELLAFMLRRRSGLQGKLQSLQEAIERRLQPKHILFVGYPDISRINENFEFCPKMDEKFEITVDMLRSTLDIYEKNRPRRISLDDVMEPIWPLLPGGSMKYLLREDHISLFSDLLNPVNGLLQQAVEGFDNSDHNWIFVDGWDVASGGHGYCVPASPAGTQVGRWFNTPRDSFNTQGDVFGTAHPNTKGYIAASNLIENHIREIYGDRTDGFQNWR